MGDFGQGMDGHGRVIDLPRLKPEGQSETKLGSLGTSQCTSLLSSPLSPVLLSSPLSCYLKRAMLWPRSGPEASSPSAGSANGPS